MVEGVSAKSVGNSFIHAIKRFSSRILFEMRRVPLPFFSKSFVKLL